MQKKILIIEGTNDRSNGSLSQGFNKLFRQILGNQRIRIIMGDGKHQAIKKFKGKRLSELTYLLIDLDNSEIKKDKELIDNGLKNEEAAVFFMIQEMEAWFISQPEIIEKYYGETLKLPKRPAKEIVKPTEKLQEATKKTGKGKYHKVKDGTALLEMLDATSLRTYFTEFDNLVSQLLKD